MGDVQSRGSDGLLDSVSVMVFPDACTSSKSQPLVLGGSLSLPGSIGVPPLHCGAGGLYSLQI